MLRFKDVLLDIIKSNKTNTTGQLVDMNLLQKVNLLADYLMEGVFQG